jgi:hypothetical protein
MLRLKEKINFSKELKTLLLPKIAKSKKQPGRNKTSAKAI